MTFSGHNPHLFNWRSKASAHKMSLEKGDIDQWMKRVDMASEFTVSEVLSHKKPNAGITSLVLPLQSTEQLRHHDEAYSEAQALLSDWMTTKLRTELAMEEDDDPMNGAERTSPAAAHPNALDYNNFDDLYKHLAEEEEHSTVNGFLQDLMEREVSGIMDELALDDKRKDPTITMEARHQQVREKKAQREAERRLLQEEREAQRGAREEAKRREREGDRRSKQDARRQEEMVQQEMVRLRREMKEKRGLERLNRLRDREKEEEQRSTRELQLVPALSTKQQQRITERQQREERVQTMADMRNLKCLQRHFSGWYSVLLNQRIRLGKAMALCDWRRLLRVWRAWRVLVWEGKKQREVKKTEEELRAENRQEPKRRHVVGQSCMAMESDRRRLLRQCLNEWQLWCRVEREQRELLDQQQETRKKMAALINAASTGKLTATVARTLSSMTAPHEATATEKEYHRLAAAASASSIVHQVRIPIGAVAQPAQPWQVRRCHAAPTAAELRQAQQRGEDEDVNRFNPLQIASSPGSRFEHRHAAQQQIITEQRRLLKEQQQQITWLKVEQSTMGSEPEAQNAAPHTQPATPAVRENRNHSTPPRKAVKAQTSAPHSVFSAMEERARRRAERRREVEEHKRRKEDEKLAEMKAAEEDRQREEEEEKRRAAGKRREEKRKEKEMKEEKQKQLKREKELMMLACQHYRKKLIQRRGLAPWKRLLQLSQTNMQLAARHHSLLLLRRCTLAWHQSARESVTQKEESADRLHRHFLLRRSLSCWESLKVLRLIQEEQADALYRRRTLRRFLLALLELVTQERLADWDRQERAQDHHYSRLMLRCFLAWREFPQWLREEKQREARRENLRQKVADVLHDFRFSPQGSFWEK
ncbi:coiled-coil domain-containing protein 191 [Genypterus blacodes]|uniref:coiled-coil domain-containing protein 191 n=1 Tax=Genypterus blacodes TaxID=154954 RepID=UPI003F75E449